ncbi:uncharacterized protein LOC123708583 [Pieris brassicae]|uniref:Ig-like domain-containing protein n=1 Tax=Pieris brassicae TaxID=7116 RepID=A0A9P0WZR7_PIEBR|nr:uncharacterized protein LOC123708583 [Pieris brassicae]CAH3909642.1 unnamed protein product [Pieris brassicae]
MVVLFFISMFVARTMCHTITQLDVPRWADPRIDAELRCQYMRQPDDPALHSVKWYRGKHEIFRYTFQEFETRSFNSTGVSVINSSCDPLLCAIMVRPEPGTASYTCEVSSEGPRFAVDRRSANMTLAVLPEYEPLITGLPTIVQAGEQAFVNCTSDYSLPPARIDWFVDGEIQEDPIITGNTHVSGADGDGLQASWRTLHVYPDDYSTHRGFLSLECRATLPTRPPNIRSMAVRLFVASRPHISSYMLSKNSAVSRSTVHQLHSCLSIWTMLLLVTREVPLLVK